jgi:DnaJ-class molecular chaperone
MNINYYKILDINEQANDEEIRKAYKRLAVIWHPDKHEAIDKSEAEIKFKEISEAYSVLSDHNKRNEYDNARIGRINRVDFGGFNPYDIFSSVFGRRDPFFENEIKFKSFNPFKFYNKLENPEKSIKTSIKKTTQVM